MRPSFVPQSTLLATLLGTALLSACGAGSGVLPSQTVPAPSMSAPTEAPPALAAPIDPPAAAAPAIDRGNAAEVPKVNPDLAAAPPPPTSLAPSASLITNVRFESTASAASTISPPDPTTGADQVNVPVTFGHAFAIGHVKSHQSITGKMADGSTVPLQVDVKARHPDGSVRHAIVSLLIAKLAGGQTHSMTLSSKPASTAAAVMTTPATLLDGGFTTSVNVELGGQRYSASADTLLRTGNYKTWLSGPVVNEWHVSAPLTTAQGAAHPHLSARFAVRAINGSKQARVDVTLENSWAYEAAPQNFTYDTQVLVGGLPVYSKQGLTHYHHARWRKLFWWGTEPAVHVKHNVAYLIGTRALPNYDQSIVFPEATLASWKARWTGAKTEPMGAGLAVSYMPATGGRDDIGLLPAWAATYLLSQDKRAKDVTLGTADLAGSWSAHYRDRTTDRPVSTVDFPYMTLLGHAPDTLNPFTKLREAFPVCASATACASPNYADTAHQPAFAYLPYLVTGDYFYLEELQFWAMYDSFVDNPGYRDFGRALVKPDQVRGQAWSLRTIGEAAYITPDSDRLKSHFIGFIDNNLEYFNKTYVNGGATSNALGVITNGYAVGYANSTGIAPWMDDFFTSAVGHLNDLGFTKAAPLLAWKAKFPISRMVGPDTCWISGALYTLKIRDSETAPFYTTIGQAFKASPEPLTVASTGCASTAMAASLGLKVGEMTGYSGVSTGYPSNMQPALAYAASVGGIAGANAWGVFMARSVKPNYALGPQFAIVPR